MAKRLFIDLEKCHQCKECPVKCTYFYHPENNGTLALRELATFALICRQCDEANCVEACPKEALEKQPDGMLKRYHLRCISCKSCAIACPFGTLLPELVPYYTSGCDYCLGRASEVAVPDCVGSCTEGAIEFKEVKEEPEKDIYFVGDKLAVHAVNFKDRLAKELK